LTSRNVPYLVVDDDEVDVMAIKRVFKKMGIDDRMSVAHNGLEALERLRGENGHTAMQMPYMILLDLNMPKMNGFEFLRTIRADPKLRSSIVFILTTSRDEKDRMEAYDLNVAGYIVKSEAGRTFNQTIEMLESYRDLVEFPN
jgi:CheY-like chemotaxis protein